MGIFIPINSAGDISPSDRRKLGGEFSFSEAHSLNGIGSNRIFYDSGIDDFDTLSKHENIEYCSFEIAPNGVLIRLNATQKLAGYFLSFGEISEIYFDVKETHYLLFKTIRVKAHYGTIVINTVNNESFKFSFGVHQFKRIKNFFEKSCFSGKLRVEYSQAPEPRSEKSLGFILKLLGSALRE